MACIGPKLLLIVVFTSSALTVIAQECKDVATWCKTYQQLCGTHNYVQRSCRETCDLCTGDGWQPWSDWGECSVTCGDGNQVRNRICTSGASCIGSTTDRKSCRKQPCSEGCNDLATWCPQYKSFCNSNAQVIRNCKKTCGTCGSDPVWQDWTDWGSCSVTCGDGTRSRSRTCSVAGQCSGPSTETENCNERSCTRWGEWTVWGDCSVTCDGGIQERSRTCLTGGSCNGVAREERPCNTHACPGTGCNDLATWCPQYKSFCNSNAQVIRNCKKTCGTCDGDTNESSWSEWTIWSTCSKTCGDGTQSRTRSCSKGGCQGDDEQTRACNTEPCQETWNQWSSCSVTCGGGTRSRKRSRSDGGTETENETCNEQLCSGSATWLEWETWGKCGTACGSGKRTRYRACADSDGCSGSARDEENCSVSKTCVADPGYSSCSTTCGDGIKMKLKTDLTYSVSHCNSGPCPDVGCPSGEQLRFNTSNACCKKQGDQGPLCTHPVEADTYTRRIIGGQQAELGYFPWMVFMRHPIGGACGGSLISNSFILTAAHCVQDDAGKKFDLSQLYAYAGQVDLGTLNSVSRLELQESYVFPEYNFPYHDIALIKLKEPVTFGSTIKPVCLPHGDEPKYDTKCVAIGWGKTDNAVNSVSYLLQFVSLDIFNEEVCVNKYFNDALKLTQYLPFLRERRGYICAGSMTEAVDSCSGDSGGPLVCQRCDSCSWYAAGVVSLGPNPCAIPGVPAIYSKVSHYEEWIYYTAGITKETHSCAPGGQ